ncbi:MAG: lamin tail domain-containing protein [Patescibacteria group bacterium]
MSGALVINEIMYDLKNGSDDGREWIEVYNNSDASVDLSTFKFFEADTNHKIVSVAGGENISPLGYAVIVSDFAKFKNDNPNFTGLVFDSTFSLSNTGENLILKDKDLNIIDQYFYSSSLGGGGDGKSLQLVNGSWVASMPTPSKENKYVPPPPKVLPKANAQPVAKVPETEIEAPVVAQNSVTEPVFVDNSEGNQNSFYFPTVIFSILLLFCACFVYFLRRNKKVSTPGDDFKILEE